MQIWPAIDLRGGKCVRLRQGDYQQETVFADDPAAVARQFVEQGAKHLHVVDLEGAREGLPVNLPSVQEILDGGRHRVRAGRRHPRRAIGHRAPGIRPLAAGDRHLGASPIPNGFRQMCRKFPGKLVLGIDARDGRVATDGWLQTSDVRRDRAGPAIRRRAAGRDHLHRHRHRRHAPRPERDGDGRDAGGGRTCR